jgi:hypothetical protein
MNKMGRGQGVKSARLTADGTSTAVAIKIQIKPFQKERSPISQNDCNSREIPLDLFPEELGQAKSATTALTEVEQANKHDEKQDDVGYGHRNERGFVARGVGKTTGVHWRYPYSA